MINILKLLFNIYFELKYQLLYYFTKCENNIIDIQNGYLIHKNTKELISINIFDFIKKIGHETIIYIELSANRANTIITMPIFNSIERKKERRKNNKFSLSLSLYYCFIII